MAVWPRRPSARGSGFSPPDTAPGVELLGDALVVPGELLGVDLGVAHDAHVGVRAPDLRAPEADVLDRRHDAAEERRAELAHHLRSLDVRDALLDGRPRVSQTSSERKRSRMR